MTYHETLFIKTFGVLQRKGKKKFLIKLNTQNQT